jgi:acyl carrier protein
MDEEIFYKVSGIIGKTLNRSDLVLFPGASSKDIEGWDSLAHLTIIGAVEKEFSITIDFMEILEIKTIEDICKTVENSKK